MPRRLEFQSLALGPVRYVMNLIARMLAKLDGLRNPSPIEKRRGQRVPHECQTNLRCTDPQRESGAYGTSLGLSQDISDGGIRVQCFRQIPVKADVEINLICPDNPHPIHARGAVVWASPADSSAGYWVFGIAFHQLDQATELRIADLVQRASTNEPVGTQSQVDPRAQLTLGVTPGHDAQ